MKKSAMGAFRSSKNNAFMIVAAVAVAMVSGCQSVDATKTNSVLGKPVVHSLGSKPAVEPVRAMFIAHSSRSEPLVQMTSAARTIERAYAFASPPRIKARTPAPVKASYNPGNGGTFLGNSPYICSPSGFGQRASCRPRYS
ncbi:hypothetical protein [Mesorhizobium sangaii]|uniref:Lipoprotein n=1 Tax=Mesorhizobium sangaii TaxID=505389 RepID=A0A841P435_9HYPH|nr:hypothetical protein [Mesorhizobium sangaii]MBB6408003.1 hypothetical protein [Mesorhizobium sangaii]